jgi:hypothetical protein
MRGLLSGVGSVPLLAGVALAAQPVPLSDVQMDAIGAGQVVETSGGLTLAPAIGAGLGVPGNFLFFVNETNIQNTGTVIVSESPVACGGCFLSNIGSENLFISAQFGPIPGASNSTMIGTIVP